MLCCATAAVLSCWQHAQPNASAASVLSPPPPPGPMDVIKTRLMAQGKAEAAGSSSSSSAGAPQQQRYSSMLDALVKIPRQEGITALWRGLLPRLMRIPPGQAIVWGVSDQITGCGESRGSRACVVARSYGSSTDRHSLLAPPHAGTLSATSASVCTQQLLCDCEHGWQRECLMQLYRSPSCKHWTQRSLEGPPHALQQHQCTDHTRPATGLAAAAAHKTH
jgi:hypothetical protein